MRDESGIDVEYRRIGTLETAARPRRSPEHGYVAAEPLTIALAALRNAAARVSFVRASTRVAREAQLSGVTHGDRIVRRRHMSSSPPARGANTIEGIRVPPLRPVRGQLLRLGWNSAPLSTIVWGPRCYVVPWLDGTVLVGATVEEAGFDERTTAAGIQGLLDAVCELLPAAHDATFIEARVGLRPATPDELPVIGPDPDVPGLIHASGHYRNGVLLAPITAKAIADLVIAGARRSMLRASGRTVSNCCLPLQETGDQEHKRKNNSSLSPDLLREAHRATDLSFRRRPVRSAWSWPS